MFTLFPIYHDYKQFHGRHTLVGEFLHTSVITSLDNLSNGITDLKGV